MQFIASLIAAAALASNVVAHPGHDIQEEIAERAAYMQFAKKDLSHCSAKLKARGMDKSNVARRAALARNARKKRSIQEGQSSRSLPPPSTSQMANHMQMPHT
jgi:hypothetical protein